MNAAYYHEEYELPRPSIWHRLNRLLWVLLILTMIGCVIGAFLPELQKQRNEVAERARLHRLIDAQRKVNARHESEIRWIQNDPEYLGAIARDKLDMMKEGDTVIRVEAAKSAVLTPEPSLVPHRSAPLN